MLFGLAVTYKDNYFSFFLQAWSEDDPNVVACVSGDGSLQIWNIDIIETLGKNAVPHCYYKEHTKEIYSIDWSKSNQHALIMTASWDCSIKLWDPNHSKSLATYLGHSESIYCAKFAHQMSKVFASVGCDGFLKLWSALDNRPSASIKAHDAEVRIFSGLE